MIELLCHIFDTSGFPARWHCGRWSAQLGWTHIISDLAIFGAYAAIPAVLAYFIVRRRDMPFPSIFWLFAAFIFACGFGHFVEATIFWHPWYRFAALVKVCTAIVSWSTVIALVPLVPRALALPGLAAVNRQLQKEIQERKRGEQQQEETEELRRRADKMASELLSRTQELQAVNERQRRANKALAAEICERRRAEETLRANEECFRILVENVKDYAIFGLDWKGRILSWNAGAEAINGYRAEEIIGQHFSKFYPPEEIDRGWPEEELAKAAAEGRVEDEGWRVRKDGSCFWANATITALRDASGKLIGFSKVSRDLTERKRAQEKLAEYNEQLQRTNNELQAANKELEAFSYSVSHDLRSPLRAIDGFSQILLNEYAAALPAEAQEFLHDVRANTQCMGQLVDDLLALSRLGRQPLNTGPTDHEDIVSCCLEELRRDRPDLHIEAVVGQLPSCSADARLLKQVWMNLLSNAWKYSSRRDAPRVEIGAEPDNATQNPVYFVKDNGIG